MYQYTGVLSPRRSSHQTSVHQPRASHPPTELLSDPTPWRGPFIPCSYLGSQIMMARLGSSWSINRDGTPDPDPARQRSYTIIVPCIRTCIRWECWFAASRPKRQRPGQPGTQHDWRGKHPDGSLTFQTALQRGASSDGKHLQTHGLDEEPVGYL